MNPDVTILSIRPNSIEDSARTTDATRAAIEKAIKAGFHHCLKCLSVRTSVSPDGARRCSRCGSTRIKYCPAIA